MPAVTQPNVIVDSDGWTEISADTTQKLQLLVGSAGVIYAETEPASSIQVGDKGHILSPRDFLSTATGGTAWGRAENGSRQAHFAVTEG